MRKARTNLSYLVFLLVFLLVITIAGCGEGGNVNPTADNDYHKGTKGVEMKFLENSPPSKIYNGDKFVLSVELRNQGAYPESGADSFEGKVEISGFPATMINGRWDGGNEIPPSLEGKSMYSPKGGYEIMTYKDSRGVRIIESKDIMRLPIVAHICYQYKTIATPSVCIDPDPYGIIEENKACKFDAGINVAGGQGAPVSITSVVERVTSENVIFDITLTNAGGGTVYDSRAYYDCPFNEDRVTNINKLRVKASLPYDSHPECSPRGAGTTPLTSSDSGRTWFLSCKFMKPPGESAFTDTLLIEAEYVYYNSIKKEIEVVNLK